MLADTDLLPWSLFVTGILAVLALDLGVFHKKAHQPSFREALGWTCVWATLAVGFGAWLGWNRGSTSCADFYTGYVLEMSLSMDNVFVFILVLKALAIPSVLQHRVLFWGVLMALVLRGVLIVAGAALIAQWQAILYAFGVLLLWLGAKQLLGAMRGKHDDDGSPSDGKLLQWLRAKLRVTELHGEQFWVRQGDRLHATPLFLALLMIGVSDVVFAVDSIPAVFAVTQDPFLVLTSNVFAVLGLRSLFFVLARMIDRFEYLEYGIAIVLMFVGGKLLALWFGVHVPPLLSLGIVLGVLGTSVTLSLFRSHNS